MTGALAAPLMRVWVDAQLPPSLARWSTQNHQVLAEHIADLTLLRADDALIFLAAQTAGIQIVISKDEDFVNLLERHGPPQQIAWVTGGHVRNAELRSIVSRAWPRIAQLLRSGEPLVEIGCRTEQPDT